MPLVLATAAVIFVLDQISKYYILHVLDLLSVQRLDVAPPFLVLRMTWNYGINFGLFGGGGEAARWGLIAVALAITAGVLWWARTGAMGRMGHLSAGLLVGGALGNVIDRILYGGVADFLNMSCCGFTNPYAFNVADIAIFLGALGLIFFTGDAKKTA
jgi:signal peptidase II